MTFQTNRKNGDASGSRVVKPQNEYVHLVSKVRRIVDTSLMLILDLDYNPSVLVHSIWTTGSQNEVGELLNLDVGSYLGST